MSMVGKSIFTTNITIYYHKYYNQTSPGGGSLELISLSSPPHLQLGHGARLSCNYDLHNTSLYSLKWYKDGEEFYRFMPSMEPSIEVFAVPGVSIDVR